jgi:cytoskeleton protein RodZ
MSSERADQPATPDNQPPVHGVPGQALAAQREAMGWSVEQVADQLKLAVRQVIALEAGDYASLPSPAVTRGFVRAYAKLVKLDPAPLVAQIAMETEPAPDTSAVTANRRPTPASFSESRFPSHGKRSGLPLGWITGAVIVVVAAAAAVGGSNVMQATASCSTLVSVVVDGVGSRGLSCTANGTP